ncbi:GNAT family N-acetyltransferase [Methylobacterium nodulans]|uniref:GCN5-related N-acetyltransferase n=1 Tax=Methylobacterium nodulans (strain LMG 21967 / CNCM I-2342 / ORS 2060) TaxID=460265 RepID=B8IHI8_METNO|nr:GNAT family N-acetyltransferase [Methylobacterium nodulans]ACL61651.1 GCN5-related N-acetyltransferase [Methylobacterium nodulans ORS 2060]
MEPISTYAASERLRDGRSLTIRALRPEDREGLLAAVDRFGEQSRYLRFFGPKRGFSDKEIDYFVNVDFRGHVALVALVDETARPTVIGGSRYIVTGPGVAELACAVADDYQGQGVGTALMRHLIAIASKSGLRELTAEVLADNAPMLTLLARCGLTVSRQRDGQVVHVVARLPES